MAPVDLAVISNELFELLFAPYNLAGLVLDLDCLAVLEGSHEATIETMKEGFVSDCHQTLHI